MKKYLMFLIPSALLSVSCAEDEPDCMKCYSEVTEIETHSTKKENTGTFCDEELDKKLTQKPITLDGNTSEWVCE